MTEKTYESDTMDKQIEFFKSLIDGVENSNHAAEQAMGKAYASLHPEPLSFGVKMTNPSAGEGNPQKTGYFVRKKVRTGRVNPGTTYEFTDKKGLFWEISSKAFETVS